MLPGPGRRRVIAIRPEPVRDSEQVLERVQRSRRRTRNLLGERRAGRRLGATELLERFVQHLREDTDGGRPARLTGGVVIDTALGFNVAESLIELRDGVERARVHGGPPVGRGHALAEDRGDRSRREERGRLTPVQVEDVVDELEVLAHRLRGRLVVRDQQLREHR